MKHAPPLSYRAYHGTLIEDFPLPGDDDLLLTLTIQTKQRRDHCLTKEEHDARACTYIQLRYHTDTCWVDGCTWCGCTNTWSGFDNW